MEDLAATPDGSNRPLMAGENRAVQQSSATQPSQTITNSRVSRPSRGSHPGDPCGEPRHSHLTSATTCSRNTFGQRPCFAPCEATGPSRTSCTGCSTSSSRKMPTEPEMTMRPRTSLSCENSPSTSCALTRRKYPCGRKSKAQHGTTASFSASSHICDSPALKGEVKLLTRPHPSRIERFPG